MSTLPRFYVREHEGFRTMRVSGGSKKKQSVEVMVIDRDYSHRVILSLRGQIGGPQMLERRRVQAAAVCAELNLEAAREPVFC